MAVRRGLLVMTWRGWGISKGYRRAPATEKLLLASHAVLVGLKSCRPGLDQSVLDRTHNIRWKHRPGINRTGHRLLPRLQHLIHLAPGRMVDERVGIHEDLIELPAKEQGVRSSNILDDGVQNV
jgi:hypothetical protein